MGVVVVVVEFVIVKVGVEVEVGASELGLKGVPITCDCHVGDQSDVVRYHSGEIFTVDYA